MKCENCHGTGEGSTEFSACFICDGSGTLCDICGEASDADIDTCPDCEDE